MKVAKKEKMKVKNGKNWIDKTAKKGQVETALTDAAPSKKKKK